MIDVDSSVCWEGNAVTFGLLSSPFPGSDFFNLQTDFVPFVSRCCQSWCSDALAPDHDVKKTNSDVTLSALAAAAERSSVRGTVS